MLKIKIFNYEKDKKHEVHKLHFELIGEKIKKSDYILLFYDKKKFVGYSLLIFFEKDGKAKIDWIYGPKYGKDMMKVIEKMCKKMNIHQIILNCSIDPNEDKITIMKRLNFYISLQYKVYDIEFRKKYGPLLFMQKEL